MSAKKIVVLGSTGSIGQQTLDVVRHFPDRFQVLALAAGQNAKLLSQQAKEFRPRSIFLQDPSADQSELRALGCRTATMEEMASDPDVDLVMVGVVGRAGLGPILAGLRAGKTMALANKEPIIMAGELITQEAKRHNATILPVDSEPSAIWQCLNGESSPVKRLIITASGGPFRNMSPAALGQVTPEQALRHPTWRMGRKITIDSATLMNKGLEVIEAHWLFNMPFEKIEVVVHPQSIIHSMVEFYDGSIKAQLGVPDMRVPIQLAMTYPERWENQSLPYLDPVQVGQLTFEKMDPSRYPCFALALEAGKKGETYPAVLAAADEVAVGMFLASQIGFMNIPRLVEAALNAHKPASRPTLEDIVQADSWAREYTAKKVPIRP